MKKTAIYAPEVLNEAYDYKLPSAFSRGLKVKISSPAILIYISGTASVSENGDSIHIGDFRAQTLRTYKNITALIQSAGATWNDVVKTIIYIKDIKKDYKAFNEIRCQFYKDMKVNPYPASTCVQAHMCREDLLVEIEAQAIIKG